MDLKQRILKAIEDTKILKEPKKLLSTYDSTTVEYYLLSKPFYLDFEGKNPDSETIIRQGKIVWKRPRLITPNYMLRLENFSDEARQALKMLSTENSELAFILYTLRLKKDSEKMDIVSSSLEDVRRNIEKEIESSKNDFSAIIKGDDEFWDVSLSKFINDIMVSSAGESQFPDLWKNKDINIDRSGFPVVNRDSDGIPLVAKKEIERLFLEFERGEIDPSVLKRELDRWGVFEHYQDRFFGYFKRRKRGR